MLDVAQIRRLRLLTTAFLCILFSFIFLVPFAEIWENLITIKGMSVKLGEVPALEPNKDSSITVLDNKHWLSVGGYICCGYALLLGGFIAMPCRLFCHLNNEIQLNSRHRIYVILYT